MAGLNRVTLIGNLGGDAKLQYTESGQAVVNLSLATNEAWKDPVSGERKERTEWHRVAVWGKTAEALSEYLTKGRQIYVEGRLQRSEWEDEKGIKRQSTQIVARQVQLLGTRKDAEWRGELEPPPSDDNVPPEAQVS